jgi:hypothetical protein
LISLLSSLRWNLASLIDWGKGVDEIWLNGQQWIDKRLNGIQGKPKKLSRIPSQILADVCQFPTTTKLPTKIFELHNFHPTTVSASINQINSSKHLLAPTS